MTGVQTCALPIYESIEILNKIALMLLLLKTNHTHVGREPNCNLKFVKKNIVYASSL